MTRRSNRTPAATPQRAIHKSSPASSRSPVLLRSATRRRSRPSALPPSADWATLPADVLLRIIAARPVWPVADLFALSAVCQAWRAALLATPHPWQALDWSRVTNLKAVSTLMRRARNTARFIDFSAQASVVARRRQSVVLSSILSTGDPSTVTRIGPGYFTTDAVRRACDKCPNVAEFHCHGLTNAEDAKRNRNVQGMAHTLRRLEDSWGSNLRKLVLRDVQGLTSQMIEGLLSTCSRTLVHLSVAMPSFVAAPRRLDDHSDDSDADTPDTVFPTSILNSAGASELLLLPIQTLAQCAHLRYLEFEHCKLELSQPPGRGFVPPDIETVIFRHCTNLDDELLLWWFNAPSLSSLTCVRSVRYPGPDLFNVGSAFKLSQHSPRLLEHLELRGYRIGEMALADLLENYGAGLVTLSLRCCAVGNEVNPVETAFRLHSLRVGQGVRLTKLRHLDIALSSLARCSCAIYALVEMCPRTARISFADGETSTKDLLMQETTRCPHCRYYHSANWSDSRS